MCVWWGGGGGGEEKQIKGSWPGTHTLHSVTLCFHSPLNSDMDYRVLKCLWGLFACVYSVYAIKFSSSALWTLRRTDFNSGEVLGCKQSVAYNLVTDPCGYHTWS